MARSSLRYFLAWHIFEASFNTYPIQCAMKKTLLLFFFLIAGLPLAFSRLVLLSSMLNECDEYWEVRVIEINEAGDIVKSVLVASGTYDHCASRPEPSGESNASRHSEIYFDKFSKESVLFRIYPNPGSAVRNIGFTASDPLSNALTSITLMGPKGEERTLWNGRLSGNEGIIENLDFSSLSDGNYFVIIRVEGLRPVTVQLIKGPGKK
jgi:hypothetical protein